MIDGLEVSQSATQAKAAEGFKAKLALTIGRLAPRWFVVRSTYLTDGAVLLTPRWAMSFMRGPMTGSEIRKARGMRRPLAEMHSDPSSGSKLPGVGALGDPDAQAQPVHVESGQAE